MNTDPKFTDGRAAILDPIVECLNLAGDGTTYQRYEYLGDGLDYAADRKVHKDADGAHLGSFTSQGELTGSISIMTTKASHKLPRPAHIIHLARGATAADDLYLICGKPGAQYKRNEGIAGSFDCIQAINPIITTGLSEAYGDRFLFSQAAGALAGTIASAWTVVNTRTSGVGVWSMVAKPGSAALPGWLSQSSSTGALTGTAVAGTWEIDIIYTETLTAQETRIGRVTLSLTIT